MPLTGHASHDIRTFRDLAAWQRGIELVLATYRVTEGFPREERFGLVSQMRRAATSVPANIAEGFGRGRNLEFIRYLEIARGSLFELQTHAEVAQQLKWLPADSWREFVALSEEVDRIVSGLLRGLRRRSRQG